MEPLERKRIVSDYIAERLVRECKGTWGKAFEISKKTGFSAAHISNVMDGQRNAGDDFATAMAKHWEIEFSDLERLAIERAATVYSRERSKSEGRTHEPLAPPPEEPTDLHPWLTATLSYCRTNQVYPVAYLEEYERDARRLPQDRPREVWQADLQVKFWEWKQTRRPGRAAESNDEGNSSKITRKGGSDGKDADKVSDGRRTTGESVTRTQEGSSGVRSKGGQQAPQRRAKSR